MITLKDEVMEAINRLNQSGFRAYLVGGCLRDYLLGKTPQDFDIATDAKPQQVMQIFERTIPTGIKHGTVTIIINNAKIEVTTFRVEKEYIEHRWPEVEFTDSLYEDLKRRDFTINALAYHPEEGLIDFFGGIEDLKSGIIRCVGEPEERFSEDALRILRCIRFAAQLGFEIEMKTFEALKLSCHLLEDISKERINVELTKMINTDKCIYGLRLLNDSKVGEVIIPYFYRIYESLLKVDFDSIVFFKVSAFFAVLKDLKLVEEAMKSLRYDNKTIKIAKKLCLYLQKKDDVEMIIKKIYFEEAEQAENIISCIAILKNDLSIIKMYDKLKKEKKLIKKDQINIKGDDLVKIGLKGKEIKNALQKVYDYVLNNPGKNNKDELIEYVSLFIKKGNN